MAGSTSQSPRASTRRSRKSIAHFPGVSDKENNTVTGISSTTIAKPGRKTRSKSIGPGGLEVLNETTGNTQKIAPIVRSILKPTISLSPIRQIPPRNKAVSGSQVPRVSTSRSSVVEQQSNISTITAEEVEAREREKRELQERREARRKSLAQRRVSFAPEATLHTWNIVELAEDATTSSDATDSTRRASSGSTLQSGTITGNAPLFGIPSADDPPSTPPRHEIQVAASPADQRNLHQKHHRRDSDAYSVATEDLENFSSPGDSIASEYDRQSPGRESDAGESEDSDEDKDSVVDDTETGVINEDDASVHSESPDQTGSTGSSARLDHSLRQAVIQAGNQDLTFTEGDDATMDLIDDDTGLIPSAIVSSAKHAIRVASDNLNPFSPAFGANVASPNKEDETSEMSMDMTMMMGGIIDNSNGSPKKGRRKSMATTARRSMARRRSSVDSTILADETMDFVTVYGGIQSAGNADVTTIQEDQEISMDMTRAIGGVLSTAAAGSVSSIEDEQDVSMDLTQAIGGVVPGKNLPRATRSSKRASIGFAPETIEMDLTVANGRLLSPVTEYTEPSENGTINMDITRAVGGILDGIVGDTINMDITKAVGSILPNELKTTSKLAAKQLMEEEADHGQLTRLPLVPTAVQGSTDSPSKTVSMSKSPNKMPHYLVATRATTAKQSTPNKTPGTPSKQLTPQPNRPSTPSKTPPNPNISMRKTSPKRLFKSSTSKSPKVATPSLSTSRDILNSESKPLVVLTPSSRRASGIGIDQVGMGSPMVAAKLDRRASIGDSTPKFIPNARKNIRFEDPRTIELELDRERAEEEHRESGRGAMENEVDGETMSQDSNTTLRDIIKSLTPKKNRFKGRKSLAPSAKGILGKRPVELDDEEDEDATPKRLKGNRSPVKSIHLPGPQKDTTLRLGSAPQFTLPISTITPTTDGATLNTATTPKDHGRFKDTEIVRKGSSPPASFNEQLEGVQPGLSLEDDVRISLQDFLNLTNVRFMDLTTTKRRNTIVADAAQNQNMKSTSEITLADCVVAGVCTIPMLDLFQHSCRELKKYISEGRSVVREIEKDTLEDNPALFREYMAAAPEVREIMDNQFKNIKVHARGESKATWYEWRSKLFDGLKLGLVSIHEGLLTDDKNLGNQEELLHDTVTALVTQHATLKTEADRLQSQSDELANCDQDELQAVRKQLSQRDRDIVDKKKILADLQAEFDEAKSAVFEAEERKLEMMAEIKEAERVTNENRGWKYEEVRILKDKIDEHEQQTGWSLQTCNSSHPTFAYQRSLFLYVAADLSESIPLLQPEESISLSYSPPNANPLLDHSITHRFFLQNLKARLSTLPYCAPSPTLKSVLNLVSTGWTLAQAITTESSRVRLKFHTTEQILNDSTLQIQSMLLLRSPEETSAAQTKLHIQFVIQLLGEGIDFSSNIQIKAKLIYGELPHSSSSTVEEKDIIKFLKQHIGKLQQKDSRNAQSGSTTTGLAIQGWREALVDLKIALLRGDRLDRLGLGAGSNARIQR